MAAALGWEGPHHNATVVSALVSDAGNILMACASAASAVGDIGILSAFVLSEAARRQSTTRLVAFLAAADLIGEMPVIGSMALPTRPLYEWGGPWCALQAAGNWYAQMSTWLWTMAYAHHVAAGVGSLRTCPPLREVHSRRDLPSRTRALHGDRQS